MIVFKLKRSVGFMRSKVGFEDVTCNTHTCQVKKYINAKFG